MSEFKNECAACKDPFDWDNHVILVNDKLYHETCVDLHPLGYVAFQGTEFLGETDNFDGDNVCEYIPELFDPELEKLIRWENGDDE